MICMKILQLDLETFDLLLYTLHLSLFIYAVSKTVEVEVTETTPPVYKQANDRLKLTM